MPYYITHSQNMYPTFVDYLLDGTITTTVSPFVLSLVMGCIHYINIIQKMMNHRKVRRMKIDDSNA